MNEHIKDGEDFAALALSRGIGQLAQEQLWVCALNSQNVVLSFEPVAMGDYDSCPVHVPSVLRSVLAVGAPRFMIVHNHPSGDPIPSEHDKELDSKLQVAAQYVGLLHTGHMIVAGEKWAWMS